MRPRYILPEPYMDNSDLDRHAAQFQTVFLIVAVVVLAIALWLIRMHLAGLSALIGVLAIGPLLVCLWTRYYRTHNLKLIGVGSNISDRNLSVALLLSAVLLLAATAIAYFELDFVTYFYGVAAFAVAFLIMGVLGTGYNRKHLAQNA